jgi:hypothetical protein
MGDIMNGKLTVPMNWKGKGAEWKKYDLPSQLNTLFMQGWHISPDSGMITRKAAPGWDTPWIYVKSIDSKKCNIDHNIKYNIYGFIPPRCLQCWKVVVTPNTFDQLMRLYEVELGMDVPCKCGIEVRDYTAKSYGGYFYNASFDEGRERYEQVKNAVKEHVGDDVHVLLKRGCTEFEFKSGIPAPMWHITPQAEEINDIVDLYVDDTPVHNGRQTRYCKAHVFKRWMMWAHSRGDFSYLPWNGGERLVGDYVTFHEGDIDGIKDEIAVGEAYARAKSQGVEVDPEMLKQYRELSQKYGADMQIAPDVLSNALDYPTEMKNDSDQTT